MMITVAARKVLLGGCVDAFHGLLSNTGHHVYASWGPSSKNRTLHWPRFAALANDYSLRTSPPLYGEGNVGLELGGVEQYLMLEEGEVVPKVTGFSHRYSGSLLMSDIGNASAATVSDRTEEGRSHAEAASKGKGGIFGSGIKLDPIQEMKDLNENFAKRAMTLKESLVSPTPYTPVEAPDTVEFLAISAGLLFLFWITNYFVPGLVFKKVFTNETVDPLTGTFVTADKEQDQEDSLGRVEDVADGNLAKKKRRMGFGKSRQKLQKSVRRRK